MREIINSGATTILVSHAVEQVREMCNKVLWIEKGSQIGFGDTELLCGLYQSYLDGAVSLDEAKERLEAVGARTTLKQEEQESISEDLQSSDGAEGEKLNPPVDHNKHVICLENEANIAQNRPLFDSIQSWLGERIAPHHRIIFLSSFVLILLTHLYLFTNLFINHDNVNGMFSNCDFGVTYGRWLLQWATNLAGNFSSPWLDGIVAAMFLAATCTIFAAIFDIRRPVPACLMILCMVAFPTVASIYVYMFSSSQFFFSMFLATWAVWLLRRGSIKTSLLGVLCVTCSMGIYQAFLCFTAATLVLTMLTDACRGRWKDSYKNFFITGVRYLGWLAFSVAIYLTITRVCLWYTGTELTDYQGISGMGQITPSLLLHRIKEAYLQLGFYYFHHPIYPKSFSTLVRVSLLLDVLEVGLLLLARRLHKSVVTLVQLIVLLAIFPLACNSIYLMVDSWAVHNLMIYPAILPLLLPVLLGNQVNEQDLSVLSAWGKEHLRALTIFCTCGLLFVQAAFGYQFFVLTNRAYTCMALTYENAYAYFTRLTAKIELQENYTPETHVTFLGSASQPSDVPDVYMTGILSLEGTINMYSRHRFLHYFMSSSYYYASPEEEEAVKASSEFQQMPCYPAEGSIKTINGVIVVKLGE